MIKSEDCHGCRYELVDCPYEYDYGQCQEDSFTQRWKKRLKKNYEQMKKDYQDGYQEGLMKYYSRKR